MFSVIIPLYNKSAYIEKCLQSVLNQTFQEFEVIVVNDGSTDNGPQKVKSLCFGFAQYLELKVNDSTSLSEGSGKLKLINQENSGVSIARNNGVKIAKYDYIAFLDADDWWDKHFLDDMKGLIEAFPSAGLFSSGFYKVKNGKTIKARVGIENHFIQGFIDYCEVYAKTYCTPVNCSFVVVTKEVFLKVNGFNPLIKFGEDFDLWIRIILKYRLAYLNKPLAFSNQDVPANNRALGFKKLYEKEAYFLFNLDYLAEEEGKNAKLKNLLNGLRVRSLQQYYLSGMYQEEVNTLLKKVDFSIQPLYYRFIYKSPKTLVKLFLTFRMFGSQMKQFLLKKF